jgi:hypothetical protein
MERSPEPLGDAAVRHHPNAFGGFRHLDPPNLQENEHNCGGGGLT